MSLQLWCLMPSVLLLISAVPVAILQHKIEVYKAKKKAKKASQLMEEVKQQALKLSERSIDYDYLRKNRYSTSRVKDYYQQYYSSYSVGGRVPPPPPPPPPRRPPKGAVSRRNEAYQRYLKRRDEEVARVLEDKMPKTKAHNDCDSIW